MNLSRLPELLSAEGLVRPHAIVDVIEHQVMHGGTIDTAILERGLLSEAALIEVLARAAELPALVPAKVADSIDRGAVAAWFPLALTQKFGAVPVARDGNIVRVAVLEPFDRALLDELGYTLSSSVEPVVVTELQFQTLVTELYVRPLPERFVKLTQQIGAGAKKSDEQHPTTPLPHGEAVQAIAEAKDRDAVLALALRALRNQLSFAAAFVLRGQELAGKVALGDVWTPSRTLFEQRVSLADPSPLSVCYKGRAPYLGVLGADPVTAKVLAALGRTVPVPGVLFPVRLSDRVLAVVMGDRAGKPISPKLVGNMAKIIDAVSRRFEALIMQSRDEVKRSPLPHVRSALAKATDVVVKPKAAETDPLAGVTPVAIFDRDTGPVLDLNAIIRTALVGETDVEPAIEQLLTLADKGVNAACERYFARLNHPQSRPPERDPVAERMANILLRFGTSSLDALPRYLEGAALSRRHAAYLLRVLSEKMPRALTLLEPLAYEPELELRQEALQALRSALQKSKLSADARAVMERMRAELPGPDKRRQRFSVEAVGQLRDTGSVPRLIELMKESDARLTEGAKHALQRITAHDFGSNQRRWKQFWTSHKNQPRVQWLIDGLTSSDKNVRGRAQEELQMLAPAVKNGGYHPDLPKTDLAAAAERWETALRKAKLA